jgi:uncharacterized protein (DUF39 family)
MNESAILLWEVPISITKTDTKLAGSPVFPRNTNVQFRNMNVGMFSGPRPSYQRYTVGLNAQSVLTGGK